MASSSQDEQALHSFAQPEDKEEDISSNESNINGDNTKKLLP
jgi:hypothetical protein